MVRRPLLWILSGYMIGIYCASNGAAGKKFLILSVVLIYIFLIVICVNQGKRLIHDLFLFIIPVFMCLGFHLYMLQAALPEAKQVINGKIDTMAEGVLYKIEDKAESQVIYLKDSRIKVKGRIYKTGKIIVYNNLNDSNLKLGNHILVTGKISKLQYATNQGQFNEFQYYKTKWINYKVFAKNIRILNNKCNYFYQMLYDLRKHIDAVYRKILPQKEYGIISAMILGEKSSLNEDIKKLYKESGISHILAISGLHISLAGMAVYKLLRKWIFGIRGSVLVTILFVFSYGILTGYGVSVNRAVVMLVVTMGALAAGRTYDMISALSLSGLIILIQSPFELFNGGFLLSFSAVIAIIVLTPILKEVFGNNKKIDILLVTIGINIFTLPLILYFFFEVPIYSFIINILVIPLMSLLIFLGFMAGILGCFNTMSGTFLGGGIYYILKFYETICRIFEKFVYNTFLFGQPEKFQILMYYIIIFITYFSVVKMKKKKGVFLLLLLFILFIKTEGGILKITFMDVGQGDCIFMRTPDNKVYLIDGGSSDVKGVGKYRIIPFLKSQGIDCIDYIIVSHSDFDHVSGIKEIIEENEIKVNNLFMPDTGMKDKSYMEIVNMAETDGILVRFLSKGDRFADKNLTIECLHPDKGYIPESRNDYSTVLNVRYINFNLLLTGDIEADGESKLLNSKYYENCDVLKIAHHGSNSSTSEKFLEMVKPYISVISCAENNKYGHPHKKLMERLENSGSVILMTKDNGAVTIKTDGKSLCVEKMID